ncbi:MAG: 3-methyladenine DNA glycosylase AlkD [Bacteroidia bacterium]|jgi:3-methyladenine DNA glycosylase AlkD
MTFEEVMSELKGYGNENTKRTYANHGAKEPFFGVKGGDLKKSLKKTKKNHALALQLFDTGNSDAMYLAALMADEKEVTEQ